MNCKYVGAVGGGRWAEDEKKEERQKLSSKGVSRSNANRRDGVTGLFTSRSVLSSCGSRMMAVLPSFTLLGMHELDQCLDDEIKEGRFEKTRV